MRPSRSTYLFAWLTFLALIACGDGDSSARETPTVGASPTAPATAQPSPLPTDVETPATATSTRPAAIEPVGFPIDPAMRLGLVEGTPGGRTIAWGAGPEALPYTRDDQPSEDAGRANRSGWNCRTHVEYEGQPAADWYIPIGTSIMATMDGTATLYVITVTNTFDYYGVEREPYLGDPDRSRASIFPFPGPGGGKGVFVQIENERFVTEYAHLDAPQAVARVPPEAFLPGYSRDSDYLRIFAPVRDFRETTPVARWQVKRGQVIGISGDSGYSEAPHLHYTVRRSGSAALLCPTSEADYSDGGWLLR